MICTNCGHEIPNTAKVCGHCGHRLKSMPAPPAPASSGSIPGWAWALGGLLVGGIAILGLVLVIFGSQLLSFARSFARVPPPLTPTLIPTAACNSNAATFIADISIQDDTPLEPSTHFDKTWRLQNTGSCPWTTEYQLAFHNGDKMDGPAVISMPQAVPPGEVVDLTINLTAPDTAGTYKGLWILRNDKSVPFGIGPDADQPVWVEIQVNGVAPTATSTSIQDRCNLFDQKKMTLLWLDAPKGGSTMTMYLKIPGGVPGLEKLVPGDNKSWEYSLEIGEYSTKNCTYIKGYQERLYCTFDMPKGYGNSAKPLKIFVNGCTKPIFDKERTEIPGIPQVSAGGHSGGNEESSGGSCSTGLGASECSTAGGVYVHPFCDPNPCQSFCACP